MTASNLLRIAGQNHTRRRFQVALWRDEPEHTSAVTLWLALSMVSGLLLIGCANLASILLARAISRTREYAIRLATGASRFQLIRQSLIEVGLLALVALFIAWVGSAAALSFIREHLSNLPVAIPNLARVRLNGRVFLFSFAISLFAALMAGLLPALSATSIDLFTSLREAGSQLASGSRMRRLMYLLVGLEAGFSVMLLLTSGLLLRSLVRLVGDDHGLRPERVLTVRLPSGSWQQLADKHTREEENHNTERYLDLLTEAQSIAGVEAAALASSLPLSHVVVTTRLVAPQSSRPSNAQDITPRTQAVTADYFRVLGIPLLAGRPFGAHEAASKLQFALVNQAFVRRYLAGESPVGISLHSPDSNDTIQIIGVVKDSPHLDYDEAIEPEIYRDFAQTAVTPFLTGLVIQAHADPARLSGALRSRLLRKYPAQAVVQIRTLQQLVDENIWRPRFSAWLFSAFASIALALAAIGIYGVVSYVTVSRSREFAIRSALGATAGRLSRIATMQSLIPVLIGTGIGVAGACWTGRFIASLLYKTSPFDTGACLFSVAVLLAIALLATAGPALHVGRIDPATVLRGE